MFRGPEVHSFQELGVTAKARVRLFAKLNGRSSYLSEYFLGGHVRTRDLKVLHAHFLWMAPTAQEVKAKTGIPSCVTLYGEDDLFTGEAAKLHFRPALLSADVILVPSDYLLNVVRQILPELRDVRVWRIGVEVDRYAPPVSPLKERKTLLCVARLIERKGLDILIRAMPHVKKEHPDVLLKIVGEGNMRRNLESLIAELDCDSYVKIFPYQNSLQAYYSEADLYVQPSLREPNGITEGLGVCLLEAQASYLPIVASGVGGIPEAVGQNGGLLVRAG
jgi:glycosyltransferase involved in cell wall biosynthesis